MTLRRIVLVSAMALALVACSSEKIEVLKSPCVGLEGSPCGPKRPMNGPLNPNAHQQPDQA